MSAAVLDDYLDGLLAGGLQTPAIEAPAPVLLPVPEAQAVVEATPGPAAASAPRRGLCRR